MSATIHNRRITCPHCKGQVTVKRSYGDGAGYVADWDRMPTSLVRLMLMLDDMSGDTLYDKTDLRMRWENRDIKMSDNALNARVSELVGLRVLKMVRYPDTHYHNTEKAPQYEIQHKMIDRLFKAGYKLPRRLERFG